MRPEVIIALCVPLSIAVFVGFWSLIVLLISHTSGWQTLAKHFRTGEKPQGRFFPLESIYMNSAQYKGALTIGLTESGLYLHPLVLFRVGHAPLLIPWRSLRGFRSEKQFWMVAHTVDAVTPGGDSIAITFYNAQIAAAVQQWTAPPILAR